jgi:hypothetical protein
MIQYLCSIDIDDCLRRPCLHGACTDLVNNYTCTCTPGYTGRNCQTGKCPYLLPIFRNILNKMLVTPNNLIISEYHFYQKYSINKF